MRVLFDADILVFRCGFAAERAKWFLRIGDQTHQYDYRKEADVALDEFLPGKFSREEGKDYELWSERFVEPVENALHNVRVTVNKVLDELDMTEWDVTMYLSGGTNFRFDIAKTKPYKGNRDKAHRPTHEDAIKEYIQATWRTVVTDGIEADDAIGIAAYKNPDSTIIVTLDKDLDMIPGFKYDFMHHEMYQVTPDQAEYNFCEQLLMGDTTDNIPGLPRIGKAKAKKALEGVEPEERMRVVMQMYEAHAPTEDWYEYLREQGKLLWIHRNAGDDWEPPPWDEALEESSMEMY